MSYDAEEMLSPQLLQDELQRVVVSRDFMHSKRKRRFLKFVVQETLAGRADRIKAYTIAVDAFDRDPKLQSREPTRWSGLKRVGSAAAWSTATWARGLRTGSGSPSQRAATCRTSS